MLRFKIDENLPRDVAELLRKERHDAVTVREQGLTGTSDSNLSKVCKSEERIIITLDTDFSNIRAYPPKEHPGIIVLRLNTRDKPSVMSLMSMMLPLLSSKPLKETLWIVEPGRVRIRRHPS